MIAIGSVSFSVLRLNSSSYCGFQFLCNELFYICSVLTHRRSKSFMCRLTNSKTRILPLSSDFNYLKTFNGEYNWYYKNLVIWLVWFELHQLHNYIWRTRDNVTRSQLGGARFFFCMNRFQFIFHNKYTWNFAYTNGAYGSINHSKCSNWTFVIFAWLLRWLAGWLAS